MKNIAIIGIGALGKRHLQSVLSIYEGKNIYAVETNQDLLQSLKVEMPEVSYTSKISELPKMLSVAIIATSSNVRRMVFDELISNCSVENIIFEKILFQKEEDFYHAKEQLEQKKIHAWVNCARREWEAYHQLKSRLQDANEMHISAIGGQWGIGCNAIHILDIIEYLSADRVLQVDINNLEDGIVDSKRKGFKEFFGTINGSCGKCKTFQLTCIKESKLPFNITIVTDKGRYYIDETKSSLQSSEEVSDWVWKTEEFPLVYQSQLTGSVIKSILETGSCHLPDYDSSMRLHLILMRELFKFFSRNGMEEDICPIT